MNSLAWIVDVPPPKDRLCSGRDDVRVQPDEQSADFADERAIDEKRSRDSTCTQPWTQASNWPSAPEGRSVCRRVDGTRADRRT